MIGRMILLSITMILGLSAVFIGGMFAAMGRPSDTTMGYMLLPTGLLVGGYSLWKLIRLNKAFQVKHLDETLDDPERILARWTDEQSGKEIILADHAIFIGEAMHAFQQWYEKLESIELDREQYQLRIYINASRNMHKDLKLNVPVHAMRAVDEAVKKLSMR